MIKKNIKGYYVFFPRKSALFMLFSRKESKHRKASPIIFDFSPFGSLQSSLWLIKRHIPFPFQVEINLPSQGHPLFCQHSHMMCRATLSLQLTKLSLTFLFFASLMAQRRRFLDRSFSWPCVAIFRGCRADNQQGRGVCILN